MLFSWQRVLAGRGITSNHKAVMSALLDLEKAIFLDVLVVVYRRMFAFGCRVLLVNHWSAPHREARNRVSGGSVRLLGKNSNYNNNIKSLWFGTPKHTHK